MDRFLVFAVICGLGGAYADVQRNAPNTQQIDGLQNLAALASQFMPGFASQYQPGQIHGSGSQPNANPPGSIVETIFRSFFSNNGEIMDYNLSEVMQMLNYSLGIPVGPRIDTTDMTREKFLEHVQGESNIFDNIFNSMTVTLFEPNRVVNFLNLTIRAFDPAITNNPVERTALQMKYGAQVMDFQNKFHEILREEKVVASTAEPVDSSTVTLPSVQKQEAPMASMNNRQSSRTEKPDDIAEHSGSDQGNNDVTKNLETVVMNILESFGRKSDSYNQPMQWDYSNY